MQLGWCSVRAARRAVACSPDTTPALVEFLATDTEVPGSIPGATRFSE